MKIGNRRHHAQAETAARRRSASFEPIQSPEHLVMLLLRNARPFVGDDALEFLPGAPQLDGDRRWHGNMRQGVFDEIGEELREEVAVASELAALLDFDL